MKSIAHIIVKNFYLLTYKYYWITLKNRDTFSFGIMCNAIGERN